MAWAYGSTGIVNFNAAGNEPPNSNLVLSKELPQSPGMLFGLVVVFRGLWRTRVDAMAI